MSDEDPREAKTPVDPLTNLVASRDRADKKVERLREALACLLPGLELDLRYADVDDDLDALRSRVKTVREALSGEHPPNETDGESAWLIEWPEDDNVPTRWWHPRDGWMRDASKAVR